jgi:hypothetical protein
LICTAYHVSHVLVSNPYPENGSQTSEGAGDTIDVLQDWAAKDPTRAKPAVQQRSTASSSTAGRKLAVLQLPMLSDSDPKQLLPEPKQQQQQQPPPKPHQPVQQQPAVAAAAAAEDDTAMVELLAPQERQALEAAEAAMREAQATVGTSLSAEQ